MKEETLSFSHRTKDRLPRLPFLRMKDEILGKEYELSIACVTKSVSHSLNKAFRGKDKPTNILSFPLSDTSGELVLHLPTIKKDAPAFGKKYVPFLGFLVIHGMLHLKGMDHGSIMEAYEKKFCERFGF